MQIDIFNDRLEHIGVSDKKVAHYFGLWHRSFSCILFEPASEVVYLQRKSNEHYTFERGNCIEPVTVGGHLEAGEQIEDGIREVHEEIGLNFIKYTDLIPIGVRQMSASITENYIENEFQYIHLLPMDRKTIEINTANSEEVLSVVALDLTEGIGLFSGNRKRIKALSLDRGSSDSAGKRIHLTRKDLIPGYMVGDSLYLRLFLTIRKYIDQGGQDLFW